MATFRTHALSLEQDMMKLSRQHPMMHVLYSHIGSKVIKLHDDLWKGLIYTIMGQQLSNKALAKIISKVSDELIASPQRLKQAIEQQLHKVQQDKKDYEGNNSLKEQPNYLNTQMLASNQTQMVTRALPFSHSKLSSMLELCERFISKELSEDSLRGMSKDHRHAALIRIKGIGPWSLQMMDMFIFNDQDVFASGDLGVIQALYAIEGKERNPKASKKELESFVAPYAKHFSPYGTCATVYLWHFNTLPQQAQEKIQDEYRQLRKR